MIVAHATWLTWKLHRFEVLTAITLMALLAISAWIVISALRGLAVPMGCWDQLHFGDTEVTGWCGDQLARYHQVTGNEGGHVLLGLKLVPLAVGLVLGVPVVAREIELRTVGLAWSLEAKRWRWLVARSAPMLVLALVGLLALAVLGDEFLPMMSPGYSYDALGNLGARGLPLLTRGLAVIAIALLAGAVVGRTLPGILVATVLALALATFQSLIIPNAVARAFAVWVPEAETRSGYARTFECRVPGVGDCGEVGTGPDDIVELLVVPMSSVPTLEAIQAGIDLAVSGLAIAGTFIVVARRRPD